MSLDLTLRTDSAASVTRRNGAWLVMCHDPAGDAGPEEEVDAAANLRVAKRIARQMAEGFGFTGPFRWRAAGGQWWLSATAPNDGYEFRDGDL